MEARHFQGVSAITVSLLAVVYFTKYFKQYLLGKHFIIRTDYGSLRWLMNFKDQQEQTA